MQMLGLEGESRRRRKARESGRAGVEQRPAGGHAALLHHELSHAQDARRCGDDGGQPAAFGQLIENGPRDLLHRAFDQDGVIRRLARGARLQFSHCLANIDDA